MTVEFIDSMRYVILTGKKEVTGITTGQWWTKNKSNETFLLDKQLIDSGSVQLIQLTDIDAEFKPVFMKYPPENYKSSPNFTFTKVDSKQSPDIIGMWQCYNCDNAPTFTSLSDTLNPRYIFKPDFTASIFDFWFRGPGKWNISPSGQLIVLSTKADPQDTFTKNILIVHYASADSLAISYQDTMGEIIYRGLKRAEN